ncbi:MAG TPA: hypothetical protein VFJ19_06775 [Nocardioidaceae bacterium]|nr:hypothetical protein [Nocardioidaceae bacterium]
MIDILADGRYSLACVQTALAGQPRPERRTPCFFNPQHGPSVRDVTWTPGGHGTRIVPACAQDAARVERGERLAVRQIKVGGLAAAYWESGAAAFAPYQERYFQEAMVEAGLVNPRINSPGS